MFTETSGLYVNGSVRIHWFVICARACVRAWQRRRARGREGQRAGGTKMRFCSHASTAKALPYTRRHNTTRQHSMAAQPHVWCVGAHHYAFQVTTQTTRVSVQLGTGSKLLCGDALGRCILVASCHRRTSRIRQCSARKEQNKKHLFSLVFFTRCRCRRRRRTRP